MKKLAVVLAFLSFGASANEDSIKKRVGAISELYSDGYAKLLPESIKNQTLKSENGKSCVNLVSFFMEGFSGGNNSSQFLLFLSCSNNGNGEPSILGVHPLYHFRNSYDLTTATYKEKVITISSPKGNINFTNKSSIWWAPIEQNGI
jgi:hypothetical protein